MPRAIRGESATFPFPVYRLSNALQGVLVECDPSIKAIIAKIDSENNDFIVEELDDQTLVIKEGMLQTLKMRLEDVSWLFHALSEPPCFHSATVDIAHGFGVELEG